MTSNQIRQTFLDFFAARGHRIVRSSSLVPANDPTLLFSNAGMNQFKDVFLGREKRDYSRACSSQKCVRAGGKHNDLEQVGRTARHHTFFEMLGNFSFGDYFKKEAIPWAWELITDVYKIPREKLTITVFREDDEAEQIWAKIVPRERIFRMDEKDNFWAMGDTGPCGPCSEIHYDMGPAASDLGHTECKFPCDCGHYVELWNLVFMQFNRICDACEPGTQKCIKTHDEPLPKPSVDTGAGLERLAAVLQGKLSNFDTDLFKPLIDEAAELANVEYGANHETDVSLRIIADHSRAATFLISDGVLPSNEGRGYVLRLIIRRALYHGQTLGLNDPFLYKMAGEVVELMKGAYPEIAEAERHIAKAIKIEEERYEQTIAIALRELDKAMVVLDSGDEVTFREWKGNPGIRRGWLRPVQIIPGAEHMYPVPPKGAAWIRGEDVFRLHDTFGLRPDFLADIVKDYGLTIEWHGYEIEMKDQRERARASWKGTAKQAASPTYQMLAGGMFSVPHPEGGVDIPPPSHWRTEFLGYGETTASQCKVLAVVRDDRSKYELGAGEYGEIILDHTPFYAEAGGQVGDIGHFYAPGNDHEVAHITDTYRPVTGVIAHKAIARDTVRVGDVVAAVVDAERRDAIRRNHTATHLLHAALRTTLGTHVKQAGSLVAPDRLRFDFTHFAPLGEQDVLDIEDLVNQHVLKNEEVVTVEMPREEALNSGAMALFGEKYGDKVRVVSVADGSFSKELCGGTHVRRTGDIGLFKLVSESSVAAGTRRIEARTGEGVLAELRRANETLSGLAAILRAKPDDLLVAAEKLAEEEKRLRKELEAAQIKRAVAAAGNLLDHAQDVKGVRVVSARVEVPDRAAMRQMVDNLRGRLGSGVIVLGSAEDGKVSLVAAVSKDLTAKLDAGKIVKAAAVLVEGSGGGRKDLAEAGGKNPARLAEALEAVPGIVEGML